MKTLFFNLIYFLSVSSLFGQEIIGSWAGELNIQGNKLPLVFNIKQNGNELKTTMDSPMQGAKDIPVSQTTFEKNELILASTNMQFQFKGILTDNQIKGSFTQGQMSLPFTLIRKKEGESVLKRPQTPQPPFNYKIEDVTFTNPIDKNTLGGTLTTPNNKKEFPVVVLISGSG
jgi:hypothetical protein